MPENDLINSLKDLILENISDEQFGVTDLAEKSGMSRSTLLRKMQKETGKPASQFIKDVRLEESKKLIKGSDLTISEIGFKVGFNSTSYFIKCFKEAYGISPGEYQKQEPAVLQEVKAWVEEPNGRKKYYIWFFPLGLIIVLLFAWWASYQPHQKPSEKSIAVLPFKNDSEDASNIYLINGLMDAVLNNLQKIKDLKVISRTSVEKYRNTDKSIAEIADELGVAYFVEGSGQKVGDQILLNVQLIEAQTERHIWGEQYNRQLTDIFKIQGEVASKIAHQVEARITPDEQKKNRRDPHP